MTETVLGLCHAYGQPPIAHCRVPLNGSFCLWTIADISSTVCATSNSLDLVLECNTGSAGALFSVVANNWGSRSKAG
jgi:hypothetical protein